MLKPFLNVKYQPDNNGVIPKFYGSLSAIWVGICTSINGMEVAHFPCKMQFQWLLEKVLNSLQSMEWKIAHVWVGICTSINEGIVSHLKQKPCPVHGGQQGHWDNVNGGEVRNETDELQYILLTFGFRAVSDNWPLLFVQTSNSVSL